MTLTPSITDPTAFGGGPFNHELSNLKFRENTFRGAVIIPVTRSCFRIKWPALVATQMSADVPPANS